MDGPIRLNSWVKENVDDPLARVGLLGALESLEDCLIREVPRLQSRVEELEGALQEAEEALGYAERSWSPGYDTRVASARRLVRSVRTHQPSQPRREE